RACRSRATTGALASFEGFDAARVPAPASSRLIADGDSVARNAFRVGLREDTPLPIALDPRSPTNRAGITQELDPSDILEVQDMAAAIARAEMLVLRTPIPTAPARQSSGPDMFESLGQRPTDDASGPASPAPPYVATPVPPAPSIPRYVTMPSAAPVPTLLAPIPLLSPDSTPVFAIAAAPAIAASASIPGIPAAAPTALEDDAFYHPLGRMRSLADVTLDGYRPEPTLLVRAATRRKRFSWVLLAALVPLVALAAIAVAANVDTGDSGAARVRTSSELARGKTPLTTSSVRAKSATPVIDAKSATPVFDVNSLPSAGGARSKR
ncbi:MAG: hypothetical protein JWP87_5372, partial [Labilithrix sp.]|nr:hypothetical protein [Labilithrix sp.]